MGRVQEGKLLFVLHIDTCIAAIEVVCKFVWESRMTMDLSKLNRMPDNFAWIPDECVLWRYCFRTNISGRNSPRKLLVTSVFSIRAENTSVLLRRSYIESVIRFACPGRTERSLLRRSCSSCTGVLGCDTVHLQGILPHHYAVSQSSEDGGSKVLRNVGILPQRTASEPRRPRRESSSP